MLPDIDFEKIRLHRGSRDIAFEELCCQLAALEQRPLDSIHIRKGKGSDGGLEAFTRFSDGTDTGWQVKYYWKMDASLTRSLTKSFDAALANHPKLTRFVVCIPFDLPDGARGITALEAWTTWLASKVVAAAALGRKIEIELWGASQLKERLGRDEPARLGRTLYWFGVEQLSPKWFEAKLARTIKALGSRYTAESNVALPIRQVLAAVCRTSGLNEECRDWRNQLGSIKRPLIGSLPVGSLEAVLTGSLDELQTRLDDADVAPDADFPVADWAELNAIALQSVERIERIESRKLKEDSPGAYGLALLRQLGEVLSTIADKLSEDRWTHVNDKALLVTGIAGRGKSHLLADACRFAIEGGAPALLLMSSKFIEGDIWQQIMNELDLRDVDVKTFLGALDAAAEAADSRLAIMIDGINERHGLVIWPENMTSFIHDVHQYPRLAVVFSCRTTYLQYAVPAGLTNAELPRIEHEGFSVADAVAYIAHRNVVLPSHPFPLEEFSTPLFLKVCCDALEKAGSKSFPRGAKGVSAIFDFYSNAVVGSINRSLNLNPVRRLAEKALVAIAREIETTGKREILYERAAELVDAVRPGNGRAEDDLLFLLEHEGMLAKETLYEEAGADGTESVRFVFERFSDHVVAKSVLEAVPDGHDFTKDPLPERLSKVLTDDTSYIEPGIMEGLAVQLPERFGVELYDLARNDEERWHSTDALIASISARDPSKVSPRTMELLYDIGEPDDIIDVRISLAIEQDCSFNADQLHNTLSSVSLPVRDASWTVDITREYENGRSRIAKLMDWAMSIDAVPVDAKTGSLAATILSWLLGSPNLALRDKATKSLAAVLATFPSIVPTVLERFGGIDDPYVTERVIAATYGAALQGRWTAAELDTIAKVAFAQLAGLPPNVLIRDHLSSLVEHARLTGSPVHSVPDPIVWTSKWPLEVVPDRVIATYVRRYASGHTGRDEIVASSLEGGDFARYVVDKLAGSYSSSPIGTMRLPTAASLRADWIASFNIAEPQDRQDALSKVTQSEELDRKSEQWHPSAQLITAREEFARLLGEDAFEDYRAIAMDWRRGVMYQEMPGRNGPECFNLGWARRWVCWRAHEFGWQANLHGEYDSDVRSDRSSNHSERLGKKYQWMALFELAARFADNLEPLPSHGSVGSEWLRNIDPSLLIIKTGADAGSAGKPYWEHEPTVKATKSPEEGIRWRDADVDFIDGAAAIEIDYPKSGQKWLNLGSFQHWSVKSAVGNRRFSFDGWARVNCVVVAANDLDKVLKHLNRMDLRNDDALASNQTVDNQIYLGEHGWLDDPNHLNPMTSWATKWKGNKWQDLAVPAFPTTCRYERSPRDRDRSLDEDVNLTLPSVWLMRAMGIRLNNGRSASYVRADGSVAFFDPGVTRGNTSIGLIDRPTFLSFLTDNKMVAVWASAGEKNLYKNDGEGFGGRRWYSTLSHSTDTGLVHRTRLSKLESPSRSQLEAYLA